MRRFDLGRKLGVLGWKKGKDGYWRHTRYPWYFKLGWFTVQLWKELHDAEPVMVGKARRWNLVISRNPAKKTIGFVLGKFKNSDGKKHSCYIWYQKKTQ